MSPMYSVYNIIKCHFYTLLLHELIMWFYLSPFSERLEYMYAQDKEEKEFVIHKIQQNQSFSLGQQE